MAGVPQPPRTGRGRRRARALDAIGVALAGIAALWALVAAAGRQGARPGPVVALITAAVLLAVVARRTDAPPATVPGLVALGIAGAFVLGYPALERAGGGPTGYANANADLAAMGAIAAAAAGALSPAGPVRRAAAVLALALAAAVGATGSTAGSLCLALVGVLALVSVRLHDHAPSVVGGAIAASIVLGTTVAMAAGSDALGLRARDEIRVDLWERALEQVRDAPLRGVGPGRSARPSLVSLDADLRWAHHGYLQQAAEQGVIGLVLLVGALGWAYARLWTGRARHPARTLAGASALTVVAVHASVDHTLHAAAVPLTLVVLVGWATADRPDRGTPGSPRPPR